MNTSDTSKPIDPSLIKAVNATARSQPKQSQSDLVPQQAMSAKSKTVAGKLAASRAQREPSEAMETEVLDATQDLTPVLAAAPSTDVLMAQASGTTSAVPAAMSDSASAGKDMKIVDWGVASPSAGATSSSGMSLGLVGGGLLVAGLAGASGKSSAQTAAVKLTVQDGLIQDATVYLTSKQGYKLTNKTGADGSLVLTQADLDAIKAVSGTGKLIAVGGTNMDTKLPNTEDFTLSFSGGAITSSVITPVTTLVSALVDSGKTLAQAETLAKAFLGISSTVNLSTFDPIAAGNTSDGLALRKAGAQIVQLISQLPDNAAFFTALASKAADAANAGLFNNVVQSDTFITSQLAALQLSAEASTALVGSLKSNLASLAGATADSLKTAQLSAAKLGVVLHSDIGLKDGITTNAALDVTGANTGIEVSVDGGAWNAYNNSFALTPSATPHEYTIKVRLASTDAAVQAATTSDALTFTWVNAKATAPALSLAHDTGRSASDGITSDASLTFSAFSASTNPAIVAKGQTFSAQLQYSLNGADYQAVEDAAALSTLLKAKADGSYDLRVRAYYPGLALESDPAHLTFTLDRHVDLIADYGIKAVVDGMSTDLVLSDQVFSTQGATSALLTLNQNPEAGALVSVQLNGKTYAVQADAQGHWQASLPAADLKVLAEGTYTPKITITDLAGNTTTGNMKPFTVDNTAYAFVIGKDAYGDDLVAPPEQIANLAASSDSFMQGDGLTNVTLPAFEGTAEAGALVTLSLGGTVVGSTRSDAKTGAWRIATTAVLTEGDYTPVITVTDLAGNVSSEFDGAPFTIVTTVPTADDVMLAEFDPTIDEIILALYDSNTRPEFDPASMGVPYENSAAVAAAGITFDPATADTGVSSTDGITMYPLPRITGTVSGTGDLMVYVLLHEVGGSGVNLKFAPLMKMGGDEWAVQVTQPLGAGGEIHTYIPYITVIDGAGNISRSTGQTIVIDRQAPEVATVDLVHDAKNDTGMDATDGITANTKPVFQGTAEPGATVVLDVMADASFVYTTTVDAKGQWRIEVTDELPDTDHKEIYPQVTVIDLAGNISAAIDAEMPFIIDAVAPEPAEISPFSDFEGNDTGLVKDDLITGNATPTISGMAEEGAWVTVTVGSWTSGPILADGGEWSIKTPTLADGTYTAKVVVTDLAGNVSEAVDRETFTVLTKAPDASQLTVGLVHKSPSDTGISATDGITNNPTPDLAGKAPAGATVQVKLGDTIYGLEGDIQTNDYGNWKYTVPEDLAGGVYTAQARLVDAVDNKSVWVNAAAFTVDLTAPTAQNVTATLKHDSLNDTGASASDGFTQNTKPTISGTAEAGALVTVTVGDFSNVEQVQVGADGKWSVVVTTKLDDGEYTPTVTVTDRAGNMLEDFEGPMFTVDTQVEKPELNAFSDVEGNDTGRVTDDQITSNTRPTISGTAEDGATVVVTVGSWVGAPVKVVNGEWSAPTAPLADGTYAAKVVVTDAAGNVSAAVTGKTFTVLTKAPDASKLTFGLVHDETSDTGISTTDGITNNPAPELTGKAPAGAFVQVKLGDTIYGLDGEIPADDQGNWTFTPEKLADGVYTAQARLVDAVDNKSAWVNAAAFTVDTLPPLVPLLLAPKVVYINRAIDYVADQTLVPVSLEDVLLDTSSTLPGGLTIDPDTFHLTGMSEVAGYTWLSTLLADKAGNPADNSVYQQFIVLSDAAPTSQTVNHTSAAAAKLYQGKASDDTGFALVSAPGDVLQTLAGNDLVNVNSVNGSTKGMDFAYIDGGAGTDTLKINLAGYSLDFSMFNNPEGGATQSLLNFEVFQMAGTNASVTLTAADIFHEFSDATQATYTLRIDSGAKGQTSDISDLDLQVAAVTKTVAGKDVTNDVAQLFAATVDANSGAISYALSSSGKYVEYAGDVDDTLGQNHHIYLYVDKSMVDTSLWDTKVIFG